MNFLALLGWSYDDKTTVMSRHELIERFSLDRVGPSPATFDYEKLDWLNGVHLRALPPDEYAHDLLRWLGEQGIDWPADRVRATAPLVQEKIEKFSQYPDSVALPVRAGRRRPRADPATCAAAVEALEPAGAVGGLPDRGGLRALAERLGQKPREAFGPIRLAVTGSKISPGLFESLELLGKETSLERLRAAASAPAQAPG